MRILADTFDLETYGIADGGVAEFEFGFGGGAEQQGGEQPEGILHG